MNHVDLTLDRLLRSAERGREDISPEVPFGFDTRVVALWRAAKPGSNGLARLLRRVSIAAAGVIVMAGAAASYEAKQDRDDSDAYANGFAIADSAIQNEIIQ